MTTRAVLMRRVIVLTLLLSACASVFFYQTYVPLQESAGIAVPPQEPEVAAPIFTWSFAEDDSLNPDGLPQTNIYLEAQYGRGVENTFVDTVPGGCSVLPDPEEGSVPGSPAVQCYYAGLGHRYMVQKDEGEYVVARKRFEEGSPEYEPPQFTYEVILRVSSRTQ